MPEQIGYREPLKGIVPSGPGIVSSEVYTVNTTPSRAQHSKCVACEDVEIADVLYDVVRQDQICDFGLGRIFDGTTPDAYAIPCRIRKATGIQALPIQASRKIGGIP